MRKPPALFRLASKVLAMCFTRILIEIHVGAHRIASSFNALHEVLLTSSLLMDNGTRPSIEVGSHSNCDRSTLLNTALTQSVG
jgi:hypothetical protein